MINSWRPNTCNCYIFYDYDKKISAISWVCAYHKKFTKKNLFDEIIKHNKKNNATEEIAKTEKDRIGFVKHQL